MRDHEKDNLMPKKHHHKGLSLEKKKDVTKSGETSFEETSFTQHESHWVKEEENQSRSSEFEFEAPKWIDFQKEAQLETHDYYITNGGDDTDPWFYVSHEAHEGYLHQDAKPLIDLEMNDDSTSEEIKSLNSPKRKRSSPVVMGHSGGGRTYSSNLGRQNSTRFGSPSIRKPFGSWKTRESDQMNRELMSKPQDSRPLMSPTINGKGNERTSSTMKLPSRIVSLTGSQNEWKVSETVSISPAHLNKELANKPSWGSPIIKSKAKRVRLDSIPNNERSPEPQTIVSNTKPTVVTIEEYPSPLKSGAQRVRASQEFTNESRRSTDYSQTNHQPDTTFTSPNRQEAPPLLRRFAGQLKERISGSPLKIISKLTDDHNKIAEPIPHELPSVVRSELLKFAEEENHQVKIPLRDMHKFNENTQPHRNNRSLVHQHEGELVDPTSLPNRLGDSIKSSKVSSRPRELDQDSHTIKVKTKICTAPVPKKPAISKNPDKQLQEIKKMLEQHNAKIRPRSRKNPV